MNLNKFLHFNRTCPVCDEPLELYMQWVNSLCFKAHAINYNEYKFIPFKGLKKGIETDNCQNDYLLLRDNKDSFETVISSSKLTEESKKFQIYFFFLCNSAGFTDKGYGDYEINLFKGCYYRSSPFMEFKKNNITSDSNNIWFLENSQDITKELINNDESFSFKLLNRDNERVYMLNVNYDKKETKLWHYTVPEGERSKPGFQPKLFSKTLPLLSNRPDFSFSNREKLIDRFDAWILMS